MKTWSERVGRSWMGLCVVALCACLKSNEGSAGSETHFLSSCKGSCPAPFSCSCGVCTLACTSDAVCGAQFAQASCSANSEAQDSCRAAPRVCDVECRADAECSGLGDGFSCRSGQCRPAESDDQPNAGGASDEVPASATASALGFTQLALGRMHSCALHEEGRVYCWGHNGLGALGAMPAAGAWDRGYAQMVGVPGLVASIYAGSFTSCSIGRAGNTICWGKLFEAQNGQEGAHQASHNWMPQLIEGLERIAELALGDAFSCARLDDGEVRCWGLNHRGQLGDGTRVGRAGADSAMASSALVLQGATQIAAGDTHSCAVDGAGAVWCWGADLAAEKLQPQDSDALAAQRVPLSAAVKVAVGRLHACAVEQSGGVKCWGSNRSGQLGNGSTESSATPVTVLMIDDAVDIAVGDNKTCALRGSGRVACWGENFQGVLGTGEGSRETPAAVLDLDDAYAVGAGDSTFCALSRSRGLLCWGSNANKQVGDGTTELRDRPVPVLVVR